MLLATLVVIYLLHQARVIASVQKAWTRQVLTPPIGSQSTTLQAASTVMVTQPLLTVSTLCAAVLTV